MSSRPLCQGLLAPLAAIALLVAAGGGCGGPSSYDDFRDQLAGRWCARLVRCGQLGASEISHCTPPPNYLTVDGLDIDASIDRGAQQFHGGHAQNCLDAIKRAPCDDAQATDEFFRYCHGIVEPRLTPGKACRSSVECLGGGCVEPVASCGGTCVAFAATGAACSPLTTADPSQRCDPTVHYCDGVCKLQKEKGASCVNDDECTFDLFCVGGKCSNPPRTAVGKPCDNVTLPPCQDGLYCNVDLRCAPELSTGAACTGGDCRDGLTCVAGRCAAFSDVGGACVASDSGATGCPASQTCGGATCQAGGVALSGPGYRCTSDGDCAAGLWCNTICTYRAGLAGSCRASDNCSDGLTCDTSQTCSLAACTPAS